MWGENIFTMKQKQFNWEIWLKNPKKLEKSFKFYMSKKIIKIEKETKYLLKSHLKKQNITSNLLIF